MIDIKGYASVIRYKKKTPKELNKIFKQDKFKALQASNLARVSSVRDELANFFT